LEVFLNFIEKLKVKKFDVKKFLTLFLVSIMAALLAGIYGIIHDQISYTISNEYYTKFKFIQFNLANENNIDKIKFPRIFVSVVGFLATWWFGLLLGFILGLFNLIQSSWKKSFKVSFNAILIAIIVAFVTGIIGLIYGFLFLSNEPQANFESWFIPKNLENFKNFIAVGSMHNFSYFGGVLGLIAGIFYSYKMRKQ